MNQVITGQIEFVVATMCNGMLLIAGYDVLRLFRWFIPHSRIAVAVEDILYWLLASIPTFCLFFSIMRELSDGMVCWGCWPVRFCMKQESVNQYVSLWVIMAADSGASWAIVFRAECCAEKSSRVSNGIRQRNG